MSRSVLATTNAVITLSDGTTRTIKNNVGYPIDDVAVREFPWAFDLDEDDKPRRGRRPKVEQATAAPGELRNS